MNEELTNLLEGIETANNIKQYEEGLGDVVHKVGNAIKNTFGTKAGAAQRAQADAQQNLQTAQANQQANQINAQANAISASDAAQNIINLLQKAFGKQIKNYEANGGQQQQQQQPQQQKPQEEKPKDGESDSKPQEKPQAEQTEQTDQSEGDGDGNK